MTVRGGFEMALLENDNHICRDLRNVGEWETGIAQAIEYYANPEWTLLDLGAHVGFFSLIASDRYKHVIAVEANPAAAWTFARNIEINKIDNIELHKVALWDTEGEVQMQFVEPNTGSSWVSEKPGTAVRCTTIENILNGRRPEIIKIDIEGAELRVFKGHRDVLDAAEVIITEYSASQIERTSRGNGQDYWDLLSGFDWYRLDGLPVEDFWQLPTGGYENYVLINQRSVT